MNRSLLLFCSVMLLCLATPAWAATITAESCSAPHVQKAINSAVTRDTVTVPAGNCIWQSTVTIASKGITLQGAGIGRTNITDQVVDVEDNKPALAVIGASATNFVTITGFTFFKGSNHSIGIVRIEGTLFNVAFRFHKNRIVQGTAGSRGLTVVGVYGLVDHNTFDATATSGSIQSLSIFGSNESNGGFTPWTKPLTLGTIKAVYIEDNTITYNIFDTGAEDAIDAYGGARLVVRHNEINNIAIGFHGTDSGNRRSPVSFEIYDNIFTNDSTNRVRALTVRGGTGVVFNNRYEGKVPEWHGITLLLYRACPPSDQSGWGTCDGTNWELGSTDLNEGASRVCSTDGGVNFCSGNREVLCTSPTTCSDAGIGTCTTYFDGSGTAGYPCRDQPGVGPGQVTAPIYAWKNSTNNGTIGMGSFDGGNPPCGVGLDNYLLAKRDFFVETEKPGYLPYTYPHPLQSKSLPAAPTNLRIN